MIFKAKNDAGALATSAKPASPTGFATDLELVELVFDDFQANEKQFSRENLLADEWGPIVDDINETTGMRFPNPAAGFRNYDLASARIFKYIKENPNTLPHLQGLTHEQIEKTAVLKAQDARKNLEAAQATRPDDPILPGLAGSMGAIMTEPAVLATLPLSYSTGGLLQVMLREAILAGGSEMIIQDDVMDWYKSLGYDYDYGDFFSRVSMATVAGGLFASGIYGLGKGFQITKEQAKRGIEAYRKAGVKQTDADKALEEEIRTLEEDAAESPIVDPVEHDLRLKKARAAVFSDDILDIPNNPESPIVDRPTIAGFLEEVRPDEIQVDAKLFQFKEGGDAFGVTERLQDVEKWDPELAGEIMVYEYADGRMFIADGHQRLGLAKRLQQQDPSQDIRLLARVLKEKDGVTPELARVRAALKNLAQGTGSAIDAAKVFKGDIPVDFKTLPIGNKIIRHAMGIMKLSDDAFGAVINEVIPVNYGGVIGRILEDKPELHAAAVDILSKSNPANEFEAEAIVRQIDAAPAMQATQGGLFGDEIITTSLFKERATVLDLARKRLKRDKATFNTLVDNAKRIESEGNALQTNRNIVRRDADAQAIQIIQALANTKGPIADALNRAAARAAETGKFDEAVGDFVDVVRNGIESGDIGRLSSGDIRYDVDGATAQRAVEKRQDLEFDEFDEPGSAGSIRQADQLEQDMFGGMEEAAPAPREVQQALQPDQELLDDLAVKIEEKRPAKELDEHPAVKDAIEKAESIPQTQLADDYLSDNWLNTRQFDFDGEPVSGYVEALSRLDARADTLGWADDGLQMPAGAIKFEKKAAIIIGPPASGKSSIANPVARKMGAAILDADDIKKAMPEYQGGIGATAVHEESSVLHEYLVRIAKQDGKNIVVPKVGKSPKSIVRLIKELKEAGYKVDLYDVVVSPKNAKARMYARFVKTGRLVPPKYLTAVGSKPSKTYDSIKSEAIADNYARIDNNGDIGEPKRIIEDEAKLLEGIDFRLRQSGGDGVPTGSARPTDRPDRQAGLTEEEELISEIPLDQEIPVGQIFDEEGKPVAQVLTMRQIKEEIDADNQFLDTIGGCIK